jgi:hypothetical protein
MALLMRRPIEGSNHSSRKVFLVNSTQPTTMEIALESRARTSVSIAGIGAPYIYAYFMQLNHGDFRGTASLFTPAGILQPPFEPMIQGRAAIAAYLEKEAKGMQFYPEWGEKLANDGEHTKFQINGRVQTALFIVGVKWLMQVNLAKEIVAVEIKLTDSLNDLLNFQLHF